MAHGDAPTPWLEPGAGEIAKKITAPGRPELDAPAIQAAAFVSLAITLKRIVDMVEPIVVAGLAEYQAERDAAKKGAKR